MEKAIKEIYDLIESFLSGSYDAEQFSYDLPVMLVENLGKVRQINPKLADLFNEDFPEICDTFEKGDNPERFRKIVKAEFERIKAAI